MERGKGREKRGEEDGAGVVWCVEAPGVPCCHVPGAARDVSITQTEHKHSSLLPNSHHPPIITAMPSLTHLLLIHHHVCLFYLVCYSWINILILLLSSLLFPSSRPPSPHPLPFSLLFLAMLEKRDCIISVFLKLQNSHRNCSTNKSV